MEGYIRKWDMLPDDIPFGYEAVFPKTIQVKEWLQTCWSGEFKEEKDSYFIPFFTKEKANEILTAWRTSQITKFSALKSDLKI